MTKIPDAQAGPGPDASLHKTIELLASASRSTELRPILLVEDSPNDLELANPVHVARDGVEALDYLHARGAWEGRDSGDPAVVLLDLKLPRLDGLEVLERVKKDPLLRAVPIVMLTSSREERDLVRSYELGVNAFVVKPVDFRAFLQAIQELGMFWAVLNQPPPRLPIR